MRDLWASFLRTAGKNETNLDKLIKLMGEDTVRELSEAGVLRVIPSAGIVSVDRDAIRRLGEYGLD
jgi:hypothetical protein